MADPGCPSKLCYFGQVNTALWGLAFSNRKQAPHSPAPCLPRLELVVMTRTKTRVGLLGGAAGGRVARSQEVGRKTAEEGAERRQRTGWNSYLLMQPT